MITIQRPWMLRDMLVTGLHQVDLLQSHVVVVVVVL